MTLSGSWRLAARMLIQYFEKLRSTSWSQLGFLVSVLRFGVSSFSQNSAHQILTYLHPFSQTLCHINNSSNSPLYVSRMKSTLGLSLHNPVPARTLSDYCPKRKGSFPKIWSLHPLKMVLSTRSRVTVPLWIPGKHPAATRPLGPCSP